MKVAVRAEVGTSQLDKDLQQVIALVKRLGSRKLVILTQEQTHDDRSPNMVIQTQVMADVLSEAFKKDGWTIIDPHFAAGKLKLEPGVALGNTQAKEIGDLAKADYILYGVVSFRNQPPIYPTPNPKDQTTFPVTGEYDLGLFATDSGTQVTKVSGKLVVGRNGEPQMAALKRMVLSYERTAFDMVKLKAAEIVDSVRNAAIEYLRSSEQNGNRMVMNVVGLSEYASVQSFKKVLADSAGVREVRPGTFGGGKAQFDVIFVGTSEDLADKLGGKTFKTRKINVTGVTGNTIEVTLAK